MKQYVVKRRSVALALVLVVDRGGSVWGVQRVVEDAEGDGGRSGFGLDQLRRDLDRLRGDCLRRGDQGLQQGLPERQSQLQAGGQQRLDRPRDGDRRRPSSRHGGHRPAGSGQAARTAGTPEADHVREVRDQCELRTRVVAARDVRRQAVRACLQGRQQVAALVQRARLQGRWCDGAEDVGAAPLGLRRRSWRRARRPTRSAARTAGRSPTCSRTSTCARTGRRSTTPSRRTPSSGPTRP